jgi:hypothetical protein
MQKEQDYVISRSAAHTTKELSFSLSLARALETERGKRRETGAERIF